MSKSTVHIIASCTDRKRTLADEALLLRNVAAREAEERAKLWWNRLKSYRGPTVKASELYAGAHWAAVRELPQVVREANLQSKLWVISAGYGLVPADSFLHSYSATFAKTGPDTVCPSPVNGRDRKDYIQKWWATLGALKREEVQSPTLEDLATQNPHDYFLIIASPNYLMAAEPDVLGAASQLDDPQKLVIVSSNRGNGFEGIEAHIVPSDARLQATVGGILGSLHAKVASLILGNIRTWGFTVDSVRQHLLGMVDEDAPLPKYDRKPMNDEEVRAFIRAALDRGSPPSCTPLLRELRNSGRACEQKRFKNLFNEVKFEGTLFPLRSK